MCVRTYMLSYKDACLVRISLDAQSVLNPSSMKNYCKCRSLKQSIIDQSILLIYSTFTWYRSVPCKLCDPLTFLRYIFIRTCVDILYILIFSTVHNIHSTMHASVILRTSTVVDACFPDHVDSLYQSRDEKDHVSVSSSSSSSPCTL